MGIAYSRNSVDSIGVCLCGYFVLPSSRSRQIDGECRLRGGGGKSEEEEEEEE